MANVSTVIKGIEWDCANDLSWLLPDPWEGKNVVTRTWNKKYNFEPMQRVCKKNHWSNTLMIEFRTRHF